MGIVVYTGKDTKIFQSGTKSQIKVSKLEWRLNRTIQVIFLLQVLLCVVAAVVAEIWSQQYYESEWYLQMENPVADADTPFQKAMLILLQGLIQFGRWFIVLSYFIPISLIVTVEMIKFA